MFHVKQGVGVNGGEMAEEGVGVGLVIKHIRLCGLERKAEQGGHQLFGGVGVR